VPEIGEGIGERRSCYDGPGDPSGHLQLLSNPERPPQVLGSRSVTLYEVIGWSPDPNGTAPQSRPPTEQALPVTFGRCRTMDSRVDAIQPPDGIADSWRYEPTANPAIVAPIAVTVSPADLDPKGSLKNPTKTDPIGRYSWFVKHDGCYFVMVEPLAVTEPPHYSPVIGAGPSYTDANDVHHCYVPPNTTGTFMQWGSGPYPADSCVPAPPP
jgi:hypothetical protein